MFKIFFISELKYTLKQPMVYIFTILFALLELLATVSDSVQIGGAMGNVYRNSPFTLTFHITIFCIVGLLLATAFFNNAALRDYNNQFNEILFTKPLIKAGYFFGRFFGALIMSTIPLIGVFLGMLLGTMLNGVFNWIDASRFGTFSLEMFTNNYLLFILPNMFFAGTIIFALANKFKSTVISFVGTLGILVAYTVAGSFATDIDNETLAALTDTFGLRTYSIETQYYTTIEKNTISPKFSGVLLYNRLLWVGVGIAILLWSYFSFSFQLKNKKVKKEKVSKVNANRIFNLPKLHPTFNTTTNWLQFKSFFHINFLSIVKSITFKILFAFSIVMLIGSLSGGFEYFGLQSYPVTYKIIQAIDNNINLPIMIVLIFFGGELIWRDSDFKINEVIDATAHTSFISMIAKALSLVSVTTILHLFLILIGVLYQLFKGFTRIELDIYLLDLLYDSLPFYMLYAGLTIFIQVLSSNKYIGYFISILVLLLWDTILMVLDINSNMVDLGGAPEVSYSDMNGFGPGVKGALWFNTYWSLFAIILLLLAGALWHRGVKSGLLSRIKRVKQEVSKPYKLSFVLISSIWLVVAYIVYYNTQILNSYQSTDTLEQLAAEYEKTYGKYRDVATPKVTNVKYFIDLYPNKRDVFVKAELELTNTTEQPIDSLHFNFQNKWETTLDIPNAQEVYNDDDFLYKIYKFNTGLQPGETIKVTILNNYITKGFENGRGNTSIIKNGTFLNNGQILPVMGYNADAELQDRYTRKKYDLPEKDAMPILTDGVTNLHQSNYISYGQSDFINVETVISTSGNQTAIAPGSLVKQWKNDEGRNYFQYKVDTPSLNFYSFSSAEYKIAKRNWNGIDMEVYYDEKHSVNVDKMLDAIQHALEYYTTNFGTYYHKQARIIEFPRYAMFAQAFPGTMPYSEAFGFIINLEDENKNNIIEAVIAHEMAHQYWAHQLIGANMQGSTMLSESFAEYSSLMTMKSQVKNPMKMREFLKYDHDRYLRGRSRETEKELPLYKVENQGYIHYGKGSLIMYALQYYIGEEKVNEALRGFLNEYKYKAPPYPSAYDFFRYLKPQVPDSLKYLINDGFKDITLYDNRLKGATYKQLKNSTYQVTLDIENYKIKSDSLGNETKVAMNDYIDIGFFMDNDENELYYQKRLKFNKSKTQLTFTLDKLPVKAAIDPRHILIDRIYSDNIKAITAE